MYSQYLHQLMYNEKILICLHPGESGERDIKLAQKRQEMNVRFWLGNFEETEKQKKR